MPSLANLMLAAKKVAQTASSIAPSASTPLRKNTDAAIVARVTTVAAGRIRRARRA